jgi:hypothetical protein
MGKLINGVIWVINHALHPALHPMEKYLHHDSRIMKKRVANFLANQKIPGIMLKKLDPKQLWEWTPIRYLINIFSKPRLDISKSRPLKLLVLLFVSLASVFMAGTIFGWSALLVTLIDSGIYSEYCVPNPLDPTKPNVMMISPLIR